MKILGSIALICITVLSISSCMESENNANSSQDQVIAVDMLKFPQWLLGDWRRLNDSETEQTFEQWKANEDGSLIGKGYTISNGDTVFMEHLSLENFNGVMYYVVRNVNPEPTAFSCVWIDDSTFTCNNEFNDFPKNITYQLQPDTLIAIIDDGIGGNKVTFLFVK